MDWREKPGACGRLVRHNCLEIALTLTLFFILPLILLFFLILLLFFLLLLLGFFGFFEKPLGF